LTIRLDASTSTHLELSELNVKVRMIDVRSEQHTPLDIGRSIIPKLINWMWRRMHSGEYADSKESGIWREANFSKHEFCGFFSNSPAVEYEESEILRQR